MPSQRHDHPEEPPAPAGQQHLRPRTGQLVRQRLGHLFGPDVLGVRKVTTERLELPVGGVERGEFGEDGGGDVVVGGEGEGVEAHGGRLMVWP
jgi:hypothetical protein